MSITPGSSFVLTIERAWGALMTQLGTNNVAHANAQKLVAKATLQLTKGR